MPDKRHMGKCLLGLRGQADSQFLNPEYLSVFCDKDTQKLKAPSLTKSPNWCRRLVAIPGFVTDLRFTACPDGLTIVCGAIFPVLYVCNP